jgi:hypothetical protein
MLYVIRIYVDDVNVVTGQTLHEESQQDYFIVPDQEFVNAYNPNAIAPKT